MPLERYREKRDLAATPEPAGGESEGARRGDTDAPLFVIQKHAASRLHYDVRLEMDGVLKSWAVPKGPSLDTRDRRLAVHVEDHPLDYAGFEGVIPEGLYGAGTVIVWDRGTYEPVGDFRDDYAQGRLKFVVHGTKLRGRFTLVRMKPRGRERADNWLLIKERDEHVRPRDEYDVTEARPESVASGRDLETVARDATTQGAQERTAPSAASPAASAPAHEDMPMQLARPSEAPPDGPDWIHEVKYDGYRLRASLADGSARLLTRAGLDWTDRFTPIAREAARLPVSSALIDGEVVALDADGRSDFRALQRALSGEGSLDSLAYMAFDLLELDGWDLRGVPLLERKELLRSLLETVAGPGPLGYVEHIVGGEDGTGRAFQVAACDLDLEGSISKRGDRPYRPGRSDDWRKVKCVRRGEFVVGGYTEPSGSRTGFGALLLGVYEGGRLRYAGRVGTGFAETDLVGLSARLAALGTSDPPFAEEPHVPGKTLHWVRPALVVEVRFQEWAPDGVLRHPSYLGLREDKPAEEVSRDADPVAEADPAADADPAAEADRDRPAEVAGVAITNPDKQLYATAAGSSADMPSAAVRKIDLARYYEQVAERALVHLGRRPLTLVRCPHGHGPEADCFYQKHPDPKSLPGPVRTIAIAEKGGPARYLYVDEPAGLVALAQLGALELHPWNSTVDSAETPDRIVFDLDPGPGVAWSAILEAALLTRDALGALGLTGFLKGTGGSGLHVVVPIVPEHDHATVRSFARALAERIVAHDPGGFTAKMAKSERSGRIFIDYLRNAHGATAIAPFSTRARPGAPVALPWSWNEVDGAAPPPATMGEALSRIAEEPDPWPGYEAARMPLSPAVFAAVGAPLNERIEG